MHIHGALKTHATAPLSGRENSLISCYHPVAAHRAAFVLPVTCFCLRVLLQSFLHRFKHGLSSFHEHGHVVREMLGREPHPFAFCSINIQSLLLRRPAPREWCFGNKTTWLTDWLKAAIDFSWELNPKSRDFFLSFCPKTYWLFMQTVWELKYLKNWSWMSDVIIAWSDWQLSATDAPDWRLHKSLQLFLGL